jgi:hypothetical protein
MHLPPHCLKAWQHHSPQYCVQLFHCAQMSGRKGGRKVAVNASGHHRCNDTACRDVQCWQCIDADNKIRRAERKKLVATSAPSPPKSAVLDEASMKLKQDKFHRHMHENWKVFPFARDSDCFFASFIKAFAQFEYPRLTIPKLRQAVAEQLVALDGIVPGCEFDHYFKTRADGKRVAHVQSFKDGEIKELTVQEYADLLSTSLAGGEIEARIMAVMFSLKVLFLFVLLEYMCAGY